MAEKLRYVRPDAYVPVENPHVGGVFHIKPASPRALREYRERLDAAKDDEVKAYDVIVEVAREYVSKITELVDESGKVLESTPEIVAAVLAQVYDVPPPDTPPADLSGEELVRAMKPRVRLVALWVLDEADRLGRARKAEQEKNS